MTRNMALPSSTSPVLQTSPEAFNSVPRGTTMPYVGVVLAKGKTIQRRFAEHFTMGGCPYLERSMKKYGKEWFQVEQIDAGNAPEQALELEAWWIRKLNTRKPFGYNLTAGGRGRAGYQHTAETRAILSAKHTGKVMSDEACRKMSIAAKRRVVSDATRQKHSETSKRLGLKPPPNSHRGHLHSEETKKRISAAKRGSVPWNTGLKGVTVAW